MKWFVRYINEIHLYIGIEILLYNNNQRLFSAILNTYNECIGPISERKTDNILYIVEKEINNTICYTCNTKKNDWIQDLINYIEDWHSKVLNCTVFHGSCVLIDKKSVLILGDRKRGKTTLTSYLSILQGMPYLDDDCIYFCDGKLAGFNMPMCVRRNVDNLPNNLLIETTVDIDNIKRHLFVSPDSVPYINCIDIVLFPSYDTNSIGEINKINNKDLLANMLIKNIRYHSTIERVCQDIREVISTSTAIQLKYPNSETAYRILKNFVSLI